MTDTTHEQTDTDPTAPAARAVVTLRRRVEPSAAAPAEEPISRSNSWMRLAALATGIVALGLIAGISVLAIVFAIVVSIFLHELGHFIVAKRAGMKVTEFFIGFGPRIWSFQRGETEYGVKVIPAGAYVRIIGMHNLEPVDPADEARTYRAQPYRKRLPVVLAGPFANFVIAFVLLFVIFVGWGTPNLNKWTVDRVVAGSAADQAGLQPGDRIVSFNGQPVGDFAGLSDQIQSSSGQSVEISYVRDGQELTTSTPLGWRLSDDAAAALAPLRNGDQILSVNGQDVTTYAAFAAFMGSADAGTATVVFDRQGYRYETQVTTPATLPAERVQRLSRRRARGPARSAEPARRGGRGRQQLRLDRQGFRHGDRRPVLAVGHHLLRRHGDERVEQRRVDGRHRRPWRRSTRSRPMRPMPSPRRAPAATTTVSSRSSASSASVRRPPTAAPSPSSGCW